MNHAVDLFTALFYSTELWGAIGPLALVLFGWWLTDRDLNLGALWMAFLFYVAGVYYLPTVTTHFMHIAIIIGGGILVCIVPQIKR